MSTEDRSPQGRGPQHTTHYDDCGCQSAALRARIAELEARVEPTKPATGWSATMDKPTLDAATLDRWAELVDRIRDHADGERPYAEVYADDLSAFIAQASLALSQAERIATLEAELEDARDAHADCAGYERGAVVRIGHLESALMESSEKRCAAEAKLADERKHADALATPQACDGSGSVLQPHFTEEGEDAGAEWVQCDGCCACAMAAHAARRAGTTAVEREEGKR